MKKGRSNLKWRLKENWVPLSAQVEIFQHIAEACTGLDVQLVISLGDPNSKGLGMSLPGSPLVVPYAPQLQLMKKAALIITHAGLNTVLEALSHGLPMVAIPITNDQPGVAARLARIGAGEEIPQQADGEFHAIAITLHLPLCCNHSYNVPY